MNSWPAVVSPLERDGSGREKGAGGPAPFRMSVFPAFWAVLERSGGGGDSYPSPAA